MPEGPGLKSRSGTIVVKFFASNDYAQVKPDQLKAYKPGEKQTPGKKQRKVYKILTRKLKSNFFCFYFIKP